MSTRLVVIDAHPLSRFGLATLVAREPDIDVVAEASSLAMARRLIAPNPPDVVTVDAVLPDGDGIAFARELRDRYADLGIVVLTSADGDDVLFRALETGASAFVAKNAPVTEIITSVRHAAVAASSFTASGLASAIARRNQAVTSPRLSPRELQVLGMLSEGKSVPQIAAAMYLSRSTAKTYITRVYEKLGAANRAQALMTAVREGLIDGAAATMNQLRA